MGNVGQNDTPHAPSSRPPPLMPRPAPMRVPLERVTRGFDIELEDYGWVVPDSERRRSG